jgi:hypothetical protein
MADFFCTAMGKKYYEATMPRIATALEKIAESLQNIEKNMQKETISVSDHVSDDANDAVTQAFIKETGLYYEGEKA